MLDNPAVIEGGSEFLMVTSHLKGVGDHNANPGEWVVYIVTEDRASLND